MSKVNDLLASLDSAFDAMEQKSLALATVRADASKAVAAAQAALDAVNAKQGKLVGAAEQASEDARVALERLRQQFNERIGSMTGVGSDPRVTVR